MANRTLPKGRVSDFDFLVGDWTVRNTRLVSRWTGSDNWERFPGRAHVAPHLRGGANVEDLVFPSKDSAVMTLRTFDRHANRWTIYWSDDLHGSLSAPLQGGFIGDHGVFFGRGHDEGEPIHVRYFWTRKGPDKAQWQQAFARDGLIWETNWIMDYSRLAQPA